MELEWNIVEWCSSSYSWVTSNARNDVEYGFLTFATRNKNHKTIDIVTVFSPFSFSQCFTEFLMVSSTFCSFQLQYCCTSASFCFNCWLYLQILRSWILPHKPKKKFTAKSAQFLGMITKQYRDHMKPVAVMTHDWDKLSLSGGRVISEKPAKTKPHLKTGAQKKTVFGPAGWLYRGLSLGGSISSILSSVLWYVTLKPLE